MAQIFLEQIRNFWTGKTYDTHDHSTQKGHSTTGLSTSSATRRNSFEVTSLTEDTHDAVLYSGQGLDGMNVDQIAQSRYALLAISHGVTGEIILLIESAL